MADFDDIEGIMCLDLIMSLLPWNVYEIQSDQICSDSGKKCQSSL